ncbi:hypothetical protein DFH08DRAFT_819158 [Mycena albidolilacea]|uniref:Uncharacterized protein n=1 Tax=Mycena albidolilacea TaxID=1033008 RepID=A0AAD6ZFS0_9AGAR|nr:hypothetical protein DFH08DRAFT_819158 [Mycena albidolilacea]
MFSKILTFTFCTLVGTHCATSASQLHMAVIQHLSTCTVPLIHPSSPDNQLGTVKNGLYSIHNKATGGQLVAFKQSEPVLVLWNDTVPRSADLAKWRVKEASPSLYSLMNVGLNLGLLPEDHLIFPGKSDILFSIEPAGEDSFSISNPDEDDQCAPEVHLQAPSVGDVGQEWEFKPWAQ